MSIKNIRNSPPRNPAVAYVYRARNGRDAPDWVDVGKAFDAGRKYQAKRGAMRRNSEPT